MHCRTTKREDEINEFEHRSTEYSHVENKQTKMDRDSGNCEIKTKSLTLESSEFQKEKTVKANIRSNSDMTQKLERGVKDTVMEGDLTLGGGHTTQYTDDVLLNYALETYIILLTSVTPINLI